MSEIYNLLACPLNNEKLTFNDKISCKEEVYKQNENNTFLLINKKNYTDDEYKELKNTIDFWNSGWKKRYDEHSFLLNMNKENLKNYILNAINKNNDLEDFWTNEIDKEWLKNKIGINIGAGCGQEAVSLIYGGSKLVYAMDITEEACKMTEIVSKNIDEDKKIVTIQGDARFVPLLSNSLDYVFSHGVIHHSKKIDKSIDEVFRVLKPGGKAFISFYYKYSSAFLKLRLSGFLKGYFSNKSYQSYLNKRTEQAWISDGKKNVYTATLTESDLLSLFNKFSNVKFRKAGFTLPSFIPFSKKIEKIFKRTIFSKTFGSIIYCYCEKKNK